MGSFAGLTAFSALADDGDAAEQDKGSLASSSARHEEWGDSVPDFPEPSGPAIPYRSRSAASQYGTSRGAFDTRAPTRDGFKEYELAQAAHRYGGGNKRGASRQAERATHGHESSTQSRADSTESWLRKTPLPPSRGSKEMKRPRGQDLDRQGNDPQRGSKHTQSTGKVRSAEHKAAGRPKQDLRPGPTPLRPKRPTVMAPWAGKLQEQAAKVSSRSSDPLVGLGSESVLDIQQHQSIKAGGTVTADSTAAQSESTRPHQNAWGMPRPGIVGHAIVGHSQPQSDQDDQDSQDGEWQQQSRRKSRTGSHTDGGAFIQGQLSTDPQSKPIAPGVDVKKEARKSPVDQFGKVRCLCCGKALPGYGPLEQHLVDKHFGLNSVEAKVLQSRMIEHSGQLQRPSERAVVLGDLVTIKTSAKGSKSGDKDEAGKLGSKHPPGIGNKAAKHAGSDPSALKTRGGTNEQGKQARGSATSGTSVNVSFLAQYQRQDAKTRAEQRLENIKQSLHPESKRVGSANLATSSSKDIVTYKGGFARETERKKKLTTLKKRILQDRKAREDVAQSQHQGNLRDDMGCSTEQSLETVAEGTVAAEVNTSADDGDGKPHASDGASSVGIAQVVEHLEAAAALPCSKTAATDVSEEAELIPGPSSSDPANAAGDIIRESKCERHANKSGGKPVGYVGSGVDIRYCNQILSTELNKEVASLLSELLGFQQRAYLKDPVKAAMRRRLVFGLREVAKGVRVKKAKCVIVAPNIEESTSEGGLDGMVCTIISDARNNDIPVVFALTRNKIGQALGKRVRISAVAIYSADGAEAPFKRMLQLATKGREEFAAQKDASQSGVAPERQPS